MQICIPWPLRVPTGLLSSLIGAVSAGHLSVESVPTHLLSHPAQVLSSLLGLGHPLGVKKGAADHMACLFRGPHSRVSRLRAWDGGTRQSWGGTVLRPWA